jgi:hypothetical protein
MVSQLALGIPESTTISGIGGIENHMTRSRVLFY